MPRMERADLEVLGIEDDIVNNLSISRVYSVANLSKLTSLCTTTTIVQYKSNLTILLIWQKVPDFLLELRWECRYITPRRCGGTAGDVTLLSTTY